MKTIINKIKSRTYGNVVAVLAGLLLAYVVYMLSRVAFVWENWSTYGADWGRLSMGEVLAGSLRFDSSAILYTNSLWIVLMLLPLHAKEHPWYQKMCKWIFVVINSLGLSLNLFDGVYSQFTGRRTTATFFSEFSNEGNLGGIFLTEVLGHWYFFLIGIALIALLWFLYPLSTPLVYRQRSELRNYYLFQSVGLLVAIPMAIFAMRGGFTRDTRPITISNANQYVHSPQQANIVLNTPFSIIRTIGKSPFKDPQYMSPQEAESLYTPLHYPAADTAALPGRNVVVLIMESFSQEYIGPTYTPFLDSLLQHSLTFSQTFANGRKSIDAMPSSLSSVPFFVEPFILTTSSLNDLSGLAHCLGHQGYSTAFFHGAPNSSMGFQAFARSSGFEKYYGMDDYCDDDRTGGRADFDGHWAIWDEEFLQYMATSISEQLPQPFMAGLFSASSHHPFNIPARYEEVYKGGPLPIHRTIQYSDNALRRFFATAKEQPWFNNTLFVITADHTNLLEKPESKTQVGLFRIPIILYDPSGQLPAGCRNGVMQQIDIMPTVLALLGYNEPYLAFGKNVLDPNESPWAVNYSNEIYQYIEGDYALHFDGQQPVALYNYVQDPLLENNLLSLEPARADRMTARLKAIVQTYMVRMINNQLVIKNEE